MYKNFGKKKRKKQLAQTLTMLSVVFGSLTPVGGVTWAVVVRFIEPAFAYEQRNTSVFKNKKSFGTESIERRLSIKRYLNESILPEPGPYLYLHIIPFLHSSQDARNPQARHGVIRFAWLKSNFHKCCI